jgi:geranylgeranyl diphosphate synthase type I
VRLKTLSEMSPELRTSIEKAARLVDGYIFARVQGEPAEIYEASLHLIRAGGKRLRPFIVLTVAQSLGASVDKALPFAAAVELIHNFSLIHDDIMDRDEFRRGVPTVHKLWGESFAILAGDLLFAKAFEVASDAVNMGLPPDRVVRGLHVLAQASSTLAEGQALDIMFEELEEVDVEDYMKLISKKTAALFEASAVLGAIAATDSETVISSLNLYGRSLGMAFQIRDDVLSLIGDESVTGKPKYNDLRAGKKTLPIIYALSTLEGEDLEVLKAVLGNREASQEDLEKAANLIESSGAIEYANREAEKFARQAVEALKVIPDNEYRRLLEEVAIFAATRMK